MNLLETTFGPELLVGLLGAAERRGITKIPEEMNMPAGSGTILGPISRATRNLACSYAAAVEDINAEHQRAREAGKEAHDIFVMRYRRFMKPALEGLTSFIAAQAARDAEAMNIPYGKYVGFAFTAGEQLVAYTTEDIPRPESTAIVLMVGNPFG